MLTEVEQGVLARLLNRTWDYIGDDVYGTVSRNTVWEVSVDRASEYIKSDIDRAVFYKFLEQSHNYKNKLKLQIFKHKWYEGGRS